MTNQIQRYALVQPHALTKLELPRGCKLLHAGLQPARGALSLWVEALIDEQGEPAHGREDRYFTAMPTGATWPGLKLTHLSTVIEPDGYTVWHVYEVRK